jgi:DNA repair exonuclease SbcCD ATPase subunit
MTEVREDKEKSAPENDGGGPNQSSDEGKESKDEQTDMENRTCILCKRVFKNERAKKIHEVHCKRKKIEEESKRQDDLKESLIGSYNSMDYDRIKEELIADMQTIQAQRRKLMDERNTFLNEMKEERNRLKDDMISSNIEDTETTYNDSFSESNGGHEIADEIGDIEASLDVIDPGVQDITGGPSNVDLEELTNELENLESEISTKVDFDALKKMADDFENSLSRIKDEVKNFDDKVDAMNTEMEESGKKYGTYQHLIREINKLEEKNEEILEEIGFGESMNVSKIPPNILESVYESTIDDVVIEIRKNQGTHDAEAIINRTLEDIRTRTSGSELFFFDGRMLSTRNLAKAISNKLISAKQVQTTYDELLHKLLEYIPGYKAKNFRAMIKLKSQEYAVDKSTLLLQRYNLIKEDINHLKNMVGSVSNRQNTIELEINNISKSMIGIEEAQQIKGDLEEIKNKLGEFENVITKFADEQNKIKETNLQEFEKIHKQIKKLSEIEHDTVSEPRIKAQGVMTLDDSDEENEITSIDEFELNEDEKKILDLIPEKGFTKNRIIKELENEISKESIEEYLQSLLDKNVLSTERRGRHTIYMRTETNGGVK